MRMLGSLVIGLLLTGCPPADDVSTTPVPVDTGEAPDPEAALSSALAVTAGGGTASSDGTTLTLVVGDPTAASTQSNSNHRLTLGIGTIVNQETP